MKVGQTRLYNFRRGESLSFLQYILARVKLLCLFEVSNIIFSSILPHLSLSPLISLPPSSLTLISLSPLIPLPPSSLFPPLFPSLPHLSPSSFLPHLPPTSYPSLPISLPHLLSQQWLEGGGGGEEGGKRGRERWGRGEMGERERDEECE